MGTPILRGRDFSDADTPAAARVAILSEELVRRFWGDRNPVGERIGIVAGGTPCEIVGVARVQVAHRRAGSVHLLSVLAAILG